MSSYLNISPPGETGFRLGITESFIVGVGNIISTDFYERNSIYDRELESFVITFSNISGFEQQELETFDEEIIRILAYLFGDSDIIGGTPYSIYGMSIADGGAPSSVYEPTEFIDGGTI